MLPKHNFTKPVIKTNCSSEGYDGPISVCDGDNWPTVGDPAPTIIDGCSDLRISGIKIPNNYQPFPTLNLTKLTLKNINVADQTVQVGNSAGRHGVRFPLQGLTKQLDRSGLKRLTLEKVTFYYLGQHDLDGFTGLEELILKDSNLLTIDPRAFSGLSAPVTGSSLKRLTIAGDDWLTSFPWEVLLPVADSITEVGLYDCRLLTSITYQPAHNEGKSLKHLGQVYLMRNSKLQTVPREVVATLRESTSVNFKYNGNACGTQDLTPLICWVLRETGTPRHLHTTCEDYAKKTVDLPGTKEFWESYPTFGACDR